MFPRVFRVHVAGAILSGSLGFLSSALGWTLNGDTWPSGSTITMQLPLGPVPSGTVLEDGLGTWNASAADALACGTSISR